MKKHPAARLLQMMKTLLSLLVFTVLATVAFAEEYHVSPNGQDANPGTKTKPFKTISAAADVAQPGDIITVHEGVYRERVDPPRGGESDAKRITYQAAPGEKVVITGSEPVKGWEKVGNDTWKMAIPNEYFGAFNPFADAVGGEWGRGRGRLTGVVYLNGEWLDQTFSLDAALKPAAQKPVWFAKVDRAGAGAGLFAIKHLVVNGQRIAADRFSSKRGAVRATPSADGEGNCIGWTHARDWVMYENVDFGSAGELEIVAGALGDGGEVELRLDAPDGKLLGMCKITKTGGWQKWSTFAATLKPVTGRQNLCLVFKSPRAGDDTTTIWAQFPGVDPNAAHVEINKRQAVFYPSRPGINYVTVRGFELCNAATPWAGAMSEQVGLIGTHWSKGWIIENNHIHHSICTGVTLGRYELPAGEKPPATAPGFVKSIELALRDGWSKEKIGSHIVRNNHIHDCEKNAIHGSLGACFSEISGNEIHDIGTRGWLGGWDISGIKFLGGVDMVIRDNHIHRCGSYGGIWLDWMGQGAQVTGNLLHDNTGYGDLFLEMQHGPLTVANNVFLSKTSMTVNSEGVALAHNFVAGAISVINDPRKTPFHPPHAVVIAGYYTACGGDHRVYNNLLLKNGLRNMKLPDAVADNIDTHVAMPQLTHNSDGWYLTITADEKWRNGGKRKLVTTELLGKAKISGQKYENPDSTPIRIDTDYFGNKRDANNPFPGPFEITTGGTQTLKVWPKK